MGNTTTAATIDTSAGTAAYTLAKAHQADVEPRLPAFALANLAADLKLLGADPNPPAAPAPGPTPAAPAPPSLAEAMATTLSLVSAFHEAVRGARPGAAVRKAYGVSEKATKETKAILAEAEKILSRAQAEPAEALSLGILPADTAALATAISDMTAAQAAAKAAGVSGKSTPTAKDLHAAEVRMHEAIARIAGAGTLAFARNPAVRAQFEALVPKKA